VNQSDRLRLFVAVDVPAQHLQFLADKTAPLREKWPGRWAPIENQHITLKFLGWVDAAALDRAASICADAAADRSPVSLTLTGLGSFPSRRRMRVLWVGLNDPKGVLVDLAEALERGFESLGFEPEKRDFTPHLTLARFKMPIRLDEQLPDISVTELPEFDVAALRLYRSHLSPRGARYEVVREFPLGRNDATG
jgi:RNA 2',3'-cyclic 3'-phosphodiesterase